MVWIDPSQLGRQARAARSYNTGSCHQWGSPSGSSLSPVRIGRPAEASNTGAPLPLSAISCVAQPSIPTPEVTASLAPAMPIASDGEGSNSWGSTLGRRMPMVLISVPPTCLTRSCICVVVATTVGLFGSVSANLVVPQAVAATHTSAHTLTSSG